MSPLGKSSASLGKLKNWIPTHSKTNKQKNPSVGVELRAGGDPHRSEKPGWSAGDMRQWPKQKMHRHPVSPMGVLLLFFFNLFEVSKITTKFFDLFKVSKNTKKQPSKKQPSQIDIIE